MLYEWASLLPCILICIHNLHTLCLVRFERLQLKCLNDPILNKYSELLSKFSSEVDKTQKVVLTV